MKNKVLLATVFLVFAIAVLNHFATVEFWYWKFWWFDVVMHYLGGLWVGATALWFYYLSDFNQSVRKEKSFVFLLSFLSVMVIGIGWEIFEVIIDVNLSDGYWSDTFQDLIMDTLGAITASLFFIKVVIKKFSTETEENKITESV